jgi:predicted nucleic acid-binding protein
MTGFLLDPNVPSELTRPKSDARVEKWLDAAADEQLFLSVISLGEILRGIRLLPESRRRRQLQQWLEGTLRSWFRDRILPITEPIAERWAILAGQRQLQGKPLRMADGLIAATALEHDLTLVTRKVKDFVGLGVTLLDPWEPIS